MSGLLYHSRLKALNLENLELRRLRADLLLVYKILFGLVYYSHNYAVTHTCYTNSDVSALIDAIFSAFELLIGGTACPPKPQTSSD